MESRLAWMILSTTKSESLSTERCHCWLSLTTLAKLMIFIGAGATVLPGVTIGENAVVAAGAVVNKDVAPNTVVAGVPARMIRTIGSL